MLAVVMPTAAETEYYDVVEVGSFEGLQSAIADANENPENRYKIVLMSTIIISDTVEITGDVTLTPTTCTDISRYPDLLVIRGSTHDGYLFEVKGGTLTMIENRTNGYKAIYLDGKNAGTKSLVYVGKGDNNAPGKFIYDGEGQLTENTAENGGAVYVGDGGTFTLIDGHIFCNTATNGGGVYIDGGTFEMNEGFIGGYSLSGHDISNKAANGAGVYINAGTFKMNKGDIASNTATENGGGVYVYDGTFQMSGGDIVQNTATENGGGVYVENGVTLTMNGGYIQTNTAENGGGVYLDGGNLEMTGGSINENNQAVNGAGVYINDGYLNLVKGNIEGNTATVDGGGIYLNNGLLTIQGGTLSQNTAKNGGGLYLNGGNYNVQMTGGTISDNNAVFSERDGGGKGGGVYINTGKFVMDKQGGGEEGSTGNGGTITNNNAERGSAVYAAPDTIFEMKAGEITANTAGMAGSAVYIDKATLTLLNGKITNNKAGLWGGVYVDGKVTLPKDSAAQITGNSGGNLLLYGDTVITIQGILNDNTRIGIAHSKANPEERVLVAHGEEGDVPNYIAGYVEKLFFSDITDYRVDEDGRAVFIVYDPEEPEPLGSTTWLTPPGGSYALYTNTINGGGTAYFPENSPVQSVTLPQEFSGNVLVSTEKDPNLPTPTQGTVYKQFDVSTTTLIPYGTTASIGITFSVSDLPQGQGVLVTHYMGADRGWVIEPSTATINGEKVLVTATVSGFSPFAIVFDETGVIPTEAVNGDIAPPLENPGVVATPAESSAPVVSVIAGVLAGLVVLGVRRG